MKIEFSVRRRHVVIAAVSASLVVALAGGIAFAGIPGSSGVISACYGTVSGGVRVIDGEAGASCRGNESPLAWNQRGEKGDRGDVGPQGPPDEGARGYRSIRGTPDEVEVTAIGWPAPGNSPTAVLSLEPPPGVYLVTATVEARKDDGSGDLVCWVRGGKNEFASVFLRAALGAEPGHARRATITSTGFTGLTPADGTLTLECWQDWNGAGDPDGENPTVFYANLNAVSMSRATITAVPSGPVIELP